LIANEARWYWITHTAEKKLSNELSVLKKYETNIIGLDTKIFKVLTNGMTYAGIYDTLREIYGIEVSAGTISSMCEKLYDYY
jgi:transposase-like protein